MTMSISDAEAVLTAPGATFEIDRIDIRGVTTRVWKNAPTTLGQVLQLSRGYGERTFIVFEDEELSFEQHFRAAANLAHVLRDRFGVREGDRVAVAMRNLPEWSVAFFAAAAAGAVVVPLNAWWTGPELQYGLVHSGTKVAFVDAERARRIAPHREAIPGLEAVVAVRPDGRAMPDGMLAWHDVAGHVPAEVDVPAVGAATDDDATIFYTSGTTGHPKGAVGSHRNICTNPISLYYVQSEMALRAGTTPPTPGGGEQPAYLLSVPLFHATGCHAILMTHILAGGKLVMMGRWDAGRALELIERERIRTFGGVPTMVLQVLDHPDFARRDTSSVRSVSYGGAPAPPDLVNRVEASFGSQKAMNGYGLTETSALTTMIYGADYHDRPDSVGRPVPVVAVKVVDPDGAEVPAGEVGELCIKGPNVVRGYWNDPEATAGAFRDGWLSTGDVARIDDEGFVYIVDRAKDMLIRGGENIYSVEIEGVLYEHPAVAEAAVIGIPHPTLGEEVAAVVTLRAGASVTEDELKAFVAERLAAFKVPARVWFYSGELPRNPAGKVLKQELRRHVNA